MIIWLLKFILIHNIFRILFHLISCFFWCTSRTSRLCCALRQVDLAKKTLTWTYRTYRPMLRPTWPWPSMASWAACCRRKTTDWRSACDENLWHSLTDTIAIHQIRKENGFQVSNIIAIAMCQGNMKICIRCSIHAFLTEVHPAAGSFWPKWGRERERLHRSVAMNCLGTLWRRTQLDT